MNKGNITGLVAILIASVMVICFSGPIYDAMNPGKSVKSIDQVYYEGSVNNGDYNLTISLSVQGNRIDDVKIKNGVTEKNKKQLDMLVAASKGLANIDYLKLENDPDSELTELFQEAVRDSLGLKKKMDDDDGVFVVSGSEVSQVSDEIAIEVDSVKTAIGVYTIQNFFPTDKENYFGVQQYICYLRANANDEITDCVFDYIPLNMAVDHNGTILNGNASIVSFKSDRGAETFDGHISDGSEIDLVRLAYTIKVQKTKNRVDDYFTRTNTAGSPLAEAFYAAYNDLKFRGASLDDFFAISTYAEVVMKGNANNGTYDASADEDGRVLYNTYICATNIDKNKKFTSVELSEHKVGMEINRKGERVKNIKADLSDNLPAINNLCQYAKGKTISDFLTSVTHESDDLGNPLLGSDLRKIVDINIMNYSYVIGEAYYATEKIDKKY